MVTGRNRSLTTPSGLTGQIVTSGNAAGTVPPSIRQQNRGDAEVVTCIDVVGNPHGDNNLTIRRQRANVGVITGPSNNGTSLYTYVVGSPVPTFFVNSLFPAPFVWSARPADSSLANTVLARTNPSRPVVDVPVFAFELKDLPGMVKQAGAALRWIKNGRRTSSGVPKPTARGLADANLAYQFGWAPLISDIQKLLDFGKAVDKKRRQLSKLYSKGGLHSTAINIHSQPGQQSVRTLTVQSSGLNITATETKQGDMLCWGSCRWRPTIDPGSGRKPTDWEAVQAAFGLDITLSTVWEALPWSWLIDWFTDTGDLLAAHRNTIPATPDRICIMQKLTTSTVYKPTSVSSGWGWQGATCIDERKLRTANINPSLLPTAYFPFLGASQLSILSSLAITRARR